MRTIELEAMIKDMPSSNLELQLTNQLLLLHLRGGSEFLESQRDDELVDIWNGRNIISYYETVDTPTVKPYTASLYKSRANEYNRNRELTEVVKKGSAQLYLPNEHRIPVPYNHTDMVKFLAPSDRTYCSIVSHIKRDVEQIWVKRSTYFDECPSIILLMMFSQKKTRKLLTKLVRNSSQRHCG